MPEKGKEIAGTEDAALFPPLPEAAGSGWTPARCTGCRRCPPPHSRQRAGRNGRPRARRAHHRRPPAAGRYRHRRGARSAASPRGHGGPPGRPRRRCQHEPAGQQAGQGGTKAQLGRRGIDLQQDEGGQGVEEGVGAQAPKDAPCGRAGATAHGRNPGPPAREGRQLFPAGGGGPAGDEEHGQQAQHRHAHGHGRYQPAPEGDLRSEPLPFQGPPASVMPSRMDAVVVSLNRALTRGTSRGRTVPAGNR